MFERTVCVCKGDDRDMEKGDTIAAIATGMTDSGIGIVRISGSGAVDFQVSLREKDIKQGTEP